MSEMLFNGLHSCLQGYLTAKSSMGNTPSKGMLQGVEGNDSR